MVVYNKPYPAGFRNEGEGGAPTPITKAVANNFQDGIAAVATAVTAVQEDVSTRLSEEALESTIGDVAAPLVAEAKTDPFTKSDLQTILFPGDSMTAGDQDGSGLSHPLIGSQMLGSDVVCVNAGVSGWTSSEIATRQGGLHLQVGAFNLAAAAGPANQVVVSMTTLGSWDRPTSVNVYPSFVGELYNPTTGAVLATGVRLRNQIAESDAHYGEWTAERTVAGSAVSIPAGTMFRGTEYDAYRGSLQIIWPGRNNIDDHDIVLRDIALMVAHLTPKVKRFLVLGITTKLTETSVTPQYAKITAINEANEALYGDQFVDIKGLLRTRGMPVNNLTRTTPDDTAIANGTLPPSLLVADGLHLNRFGYFAVATFWYERLVALGWVRTRNRGVPVAGYTKLWEASRLSPFVSGSAMVPWKDQVANVQLTAGAGTPLVTGDGKKFITVDGTGGYLTGTIGAIEDPATLVFVGMVPSFGSDWTGLIWSTTAGYSLVIQPDGAVRFGTGSGSPLVTATGQVVAGREFTICARAHGAGSRLQVDKQAAASGTLPAGSIGSGRIGYAFNGTAKYAPLSVRTVIPYPRPLSSVEMDRLVDFYGTAA